VKGRTGLAARTSHNDTDDSGGDFGIRVGRKTGPWTETNQLYIHFWVRYEKGYQDGKDRPDAPDSGIWNIKWLWTLGHDAHNEVALYRYRNGRLAAIWQLNGGDTGWEGGKRVSKWGTVPYTFGDWLEIEIYFKLSSGNGHLKADGVQWLKLNGVKVIDGQDVVTGRPGTMSSPAIKANRECPAGHGWWQIDDYEVFDGLPEPDGKNTPATKTPNPVHAQ